MSDSGVILWEEIRCWSLLGFKGQTKPDRCALHVTPRGLTMEHPSVHLLSLVNDILIEICKTKTTANQNKGKYHQEPIRIQSEKQASCLKRGKTGEWTRRDWSKCWYGEKLARDFWANHTAKWSKTEAFSDYFRIPTEIRSINNRVPSMTETIHGLLIGGFALQTCRVTWFQKLM